jgi:hypothetical protein
MKEKWIIFYRSYVKNTVLKRIMRWMDYKEQNIIWTIGCKIIIWDHKWIMRVQGKNYFLDKILTLTDITEIIIIDNP